MGIGIVLVGWAVVGLILAGTGAAILAAVVTHFTRNLGKDSRKAVVAAAAFPFVCLGWAGVVFFLQAIVNDSVLHRDPGLGDAWYCPLPYGCSLLMVDDTDEGCVYIQRAQTTSGAGAETPELCGIRRLQVAGRYLLGTRDKSVTADCRDASQPDFYFLLDGITRETLTFSTCEDLHAAAVQRSIQLRLQPIAEVYSEYRPTRFDTFVDFLLCVPLLLMGLLLVGWIVRLRRRKNVVLQAG